MRVSRKQETRLCGIGQIGRLGRAPGLSVFGEDRGEIGGLFRERKQLGVTVKEREEKGCSGFPLPSDKNRAIVESAQKPGILSLGRSRFVDRIQSRAMPMARKSTNGPHAAIAGGMR